MVTAARNDNQARTDGRMVTEKLKMLPDVVSLLNRSHLQNHIVDPDSGIIESMRFFLEPLSDGSLPAYDIQRELFTALLRLPLSSDTLIQSSIGKIVLFYNKSKVVQPEIKRMAERLLGDWTRPLMKRSDNYKHRTQETADFDVTYVDSLVSTQTLIFFFSLSYTHTHVYHKDDNPVLTSIGIPLGKCQRHDKSRVMKITSRRPTRRLEVSSAILRTVTELGFSRVPSVTTSLPSMSAPSRPSTLDGWVKGVMLGFGNSGLALRVR